MSYPPCPTCGRPAAPRLTRRGAVSLHHDPGGPLCRAGSWALEARERGLVRLLGRQLVSDLSARVEVVYGPHLLSAEEAELAPVPGAAERRKLAGTVVTAAWGPEWAVVVAEAMGEWWSEEKEEALRRARRDPEWRAALLSVAELARTAEDADAPSWSGPAKARLRAAVSALVKSSGSPEEKK